MAQALAGEGPRVRGSAQLRPPPVGAPRIALALRRGPRAPAAAPRAAKWGELVKLARPSLPPTAASRTVRRPGTRCGSRSLRAMKARDGEKHTSFCLAAGTGANSHRARCTRLGEGRRLRQASCIALPSLLDHAGSVARSAFVRPIISGRRQPPERSCGRVGLTEGIDKDDRRTRRHRCTESTAKTAEDAHARRRALVRKHKVREHRQN